MVFAVLCGIFQPAVSHATTIVNTVSSQVTTGGQNGADGADGKNGEDGADGQDGQDGAVVRGKASSSVHIESYVNGKKIIDVHESKSSDVDGASAIIAIDQSVTETEDTAVVSVSAEASSVSGTVMRTPNPLLQTFSTIHLILFDYVFRLFS